MAYKSKMQEIDDEINRVLANREKKGEMNSEQYVQLINLIALRTHSSTAKVSQRLDIYVATDRILLNG